MRSGCPPKGRAGNACAISCSANTRSRLLGRLEASATSYLRWSKSPVSCWRMCCGSLSDTSASRRFGIHARRSTAPGLGDSFHERRAIHAAVVAVSLEVHEHHGDVQLALSALHRSGGDRVRIESNCPGLHVDRQHRAPSPDGHPEGKARPECVLPNGLASVVRVGCETLTRLQPGGQEWECHCWGWLPRTCA